jgi:hypothetical protein
MGWKLGIGKGDGESSGNEEAAIGAEAGARGVVLPVVAAFVAAEDVGGGVGSPGARDGEDMGMAVVHGDDWDFLCEASEGIGEGGPAVIAINECEVVDGEIEFPERAGVKGDAVGGAAFVDEAEERGGGFDFHDVEVGDVSGFEGVDEGGGAAALEGSDFNDDSLAGWDAGIEVAGVAEEVDVEIVHGPAF